MFRLFVSQPKDFRSGKAGQRGIGNEPDQVFPTADGTFDFGTLFECALVIPQDRFSDHFVVFIEKDAAVHLPRETDALYVAGLEFCLFDDILDRLDDGVPPIFWVLFTPKRFRGVARILLGIACQYFSFVINRQRFRAGGSNVNAEKCHDEESEVMRQGSTTMSPNSASPNDTLLRCRWEAGRIFGGGKFCQTASIVGVVTER